MKIPEVWAHGEQLLVRADSNTDLNIQASSRQLFCTHDVSHTRVFVWGKKTISHICGNKYEGFFPRSKELLNLKMSENPVRPLRLVCMKRSRGNEPSPHSANCRRALKGLSPHRQTTKSLNPAPPCPNKAFHWKYGYKSKGRESHLNIPSV